MSSPEKLNRALRRAVAELMKYKKERLKEIDEAHIDLATALEKVRTELKTGRYCRVCWVEPADILFESCDHVSDLFKSI